MTKEPFKRKISIAGVPIYIYNANSLPEYVQEFNTQSEYSGKIKINVLYLVHHRGEDYKSTEVNGKQILELVAGHINVPLICVTFDIRNHGQRTIDPKRNQDWSSGNETHAMDMVSCIDGTIEDIRVIMDNLPTHLDLESFLSPSIKSNGAEICFNNILLGNSVGGHTVIRFANKYPSLVSAINPNIGCSDLTTLIVNRLRGTKSFDRKLFYASYDELNLSNEDKKRYPEALHKKISIEDIHIFENFPFQRVKVFSCFASGDELVPPAISKLWVDINLNNNLSSSTLMCDHPRHEVTDEMITKFASWLVKHL